MSLKGQKLKVIRLRNVSSVKAKY